MLTRFAPAPTGFLHLGHVLNAIHVWGIARRQGGCVLLRIEDHDRQRSRPEFERAILDDLEWLGFIPDSPTIEVLRQGVCPEGRQSDRAEVYESALERLRACGLVYACECSRRDVTETRPEMAGEHRYPGTCADKGLAEGPGRSLRVRLEPSSEAFDDLRHGAQRQCPAEQCGDLLIRDREGNWTYQFAVTVDDLAQGVNLVIRGDDLLSSTGRQIQLARLLGREHPPQFLHHALIMKSAGQKLSKSDRDTSVGDLRRQGRTPASVLGEAAWLGRLIPAARPLQGLLEVQGVLASSSTASKSAR